MSQEKIKDTKLGSWLKEKAPSVLDTVGDLLPDSGGLGVVKNLIDRQYPDLDPEEVKAKIDAEIAFQNNVTERWKSDMGSDVKLAKLIRPVTLICLMVMFMATMVADSLDNLPFNVKDSYVSLLEILMLTAFGAYFAGRTIEKAKR
jgi:predicted transcriptional regulator